MKVVAIIAALILILIVATISKCAHSLYTMVDDFPEEARIENIQSRYPKLITDLDQAIGKSSSSFSLAAELETLDYPTGTLSVSMQNGSDDGLLIINRFTSQGSVDATSTFTAIYNYSGYGEKNGQKFIILHHPLKKYEYDYIEVYIERETQELE